MTQHAFQTEVTQLLHLMIHSLYSEREIVLRELVSNASDALDKLRFKALTAKELTAGDERMRIDLAFDAESKTLTITDTGIGMTEAEAISHLGTIAKSGTKEFIKALAETDKASVSQIGQFGVGFYASFMIADRVVVESRAAGAASGDGVRWESKGDGTYSTERIERAQRGTTVTLHLKDDATEFADRWRLRGLIKKYSDFVSWPVSLPAEKDGKPVAGEWEQINAGSALWMRPKDQISDEQYAEFYKGACKQWDEPATRLHISVEGTLSFTALLFIPSEKPMDLFERDRKGLSLYVRRVFIMDDNKDLLPEWLRFVRGVVDSDDLPLNVSREILQQKDTVAKIRKQLVKKLLDHLTRLAESDDAKDQEAWARIDEAFGPVIREALVSDWDHKDKVARLVRFRSTWTEGKPAEGETRTAKTGLEAYCRRAGEADKNIYVITAGSLAAAKASPHLEGFAKAGKEVLFLTDPVDEWVVQHFHEFDGRKLVHVAKGAADLADADAKKKLEERSKELEGFLGFCKESAGEGIKEVRLTDRLSDSPCCLVGEAHAPSPQMEELMRRMGQDAPRSQRILELNPDHPIVARLQTLHGDEAKRDQAKAMLGTLRDAAILAEGGKLADGADFAKRVHAMMLAG